MKHDIDEFEIPGNIEYELIHRKELTAVDLSLLDEVVQLLGFGSVEVMRQSKKISSLRIGLTFKTHKEVVAFRDKLMKR